MAHTTEVVAMQKLSNGQISVCVRCCNNPATDHWHTMAANVCGDKDKRLESIEFAHNYCAEQHAQMEQAAAGIALDIGTDAMKKVHG